MDKHEEQQPDWADYTEITKQTFDRLRLGSVFSTPIYERLCFYLYRKGKQHVYIDKYTPQTHPEGVYYATVLFTDWTDYESFSPPDWLLAELDVCDDYWGSPLFKAVGVPSAWGLTAADIADIQAQHARPERIAQKSNVPGNCLKDVISYLKANHPLAKELLGDISNILDSYNWAQMPNWLCVEQRFNKERYRTVVKRLKSEVETQGSLLSLITANIASDTGEYGRDMFGVFLYMIKQSLTEGLRRMEHTGLEKQAIYAAFIKTLTPVLEQLYTDTPMLSRLYTEFLETCTQELNTPAQYIDKNEELIQKVKDRAARTLWQMPEHLDRA